VGGDFHYDHVQARLMTQFGLYPDTTPRDGAVARAGNEIWPTRTAMFPNIFLKPTADIAGMPFMVSTLTPGGCTCICALGARSREE
jgi:hypothetical protein